MTQLVYHNKLNALNTHPTFLHGTQYPFKVYMHQLALSRPEIWDIFHICTTQLKLGTRIGSTSAAQMSGINVLINGLIFSPF